MVVALLVCTWQPLKGGSSLRKRKTLKMRLVLTYQRLEGKIMLQGSAKGLPDPCCRVPPNLILSDGFCFLKLGFQAHLVLSNVVLVSLGRISREGLLSLQCIC